MATENIIVVKIQNTPIIVANNAPELLGQIILDFIEETPLLPEFNVLITIGFRHTPDV